LIVDKATIRIKGGFLDHSVWYSVVYNISHYVKFK